MRPHVRFLSSDTVRQIIRDAFSILAVYGAKVKNLQAQSLLLHAGATQIPNTDIFTFPASLIERCLATAPRSFRLFDMSFQEAIHYGGDSVYFDPGSSGTKVLDPETLEHRTAVTADLIKLLKIAETLPQYAATSTMVICDDVPKEIQDIYRLYLALLYSKKPIVTGAFSGKNINAMIKLLTIVAGSEIKMRIFPRAIFDVCPVPPLTWSEFACSNLIALAQAGVPTEIVSMPLAGVAAPVTLIGTVTQHTAELLSGIVIHQLAGPYSPVVWGGAATIFDMRKGLAPVGAVETAMIVSAYTQVGKALGIPTHGYLGGSDSKSPDWQAGVESATGISLGALSGVNMISGAGMVDSLLCQSPEKLVLDAESIAMAQRKISGVATDQMGRTVSSYEGVNFSSFGFLKQRWTKETYPSEQHLPGDTVDRGSLDDWTKSGNQTAFQRANTSVQKLLSSYQRPRLDKHRSRILIANMQKIAKDAGLENLHVPESD